MKKPVQILLMLALFPMVGSAREETLEERKQRIVRKYLRERAAVTQSDMVVPSDLPEDERITESEKFKDAEVSLEREEAGAKPYMPPQPRPVQQRQSSNWLLDDTTETDTGYGMFGNTADPSIDNGDDLWSSWGGDSVDDPYNARENTDRRYNPNPREQDTGQGYANGRRGPSEQRGYYTQSGADIFGRSQPSTTQPDYNTGFGLQDNQRTYGVSPDQGLLNSPYRQIESYDADGLRREQDGSGAGTTPSGYQPYKSQYERQREERQKQWGTTPGYQQEKQQEFQRPNQYQQFKDRNKAYDPLADDAYLNQNRR